MIDDDFQPNRTQLEALGHLFLNAQNFPAWPGMREEELYRLLPGESFGGTREPWLTELQQHRLVHIEIDDIRFDDTDPDPHTICLTPAGIYYLVSRAPLLAENWRGATRDLPKNIVDAPWPVQAYYSVPIDEVAPAADRLIRFDHNSDAHRAAVLAIENVAEALRADNHLATHEPRLRDEKLLELRQIRLLLEKKEAWVTKILAAGWAAFGYLMAQFADRPVGHLANEAWHALQVLIGLR